MHRRRRYLSRGVVTALLLLLIASPAVGFELPQPDHGIDRDDFDKLWSGYGYELPSEDPSLNDYTTKASDYVYSEPPGAPDRWNAGEVREFVGGRELFSLHPPDADLRDGEVVKDFYMRTFGVSRSTLVHFSPQREVLYVPSDGEVRGLTDYRIEGDNVINHSVEVEIVETGDKTSGNGGFSIPYEGLTRGDLTRHDSRGEPTRTNFSPGDETSEMTIRAEVTATYMIENGGETEPVTETVTVEETIEVRPYDTSLPPPVAVYGRYPNDDTALFFLREGPWSSVTLPDGTTVHSNWRFFSARETGWEGMRVSTAAGGGFRGDKSYHLLQVHAYPSRSGVHVDGDAELRNVLGDEYDPPSLSDGLSFALPTERYKTTQGFDLRHNGDAEVGSVELNGIVHGTSTERPPFPSVQDIRTTDLGLSVTEVSDDSVEVEVSLQDNKGNPVGTRRDDGFVRVDGHGRVNTSIDGTAEIEISPPPSGAVVAEYVPVNWYEASAEATYVGDTASINPRRDYGLFAELGMLSQLGVFLLPFLLSVYFLDKTLGLGIWPPWRRI
jgi:hypothetical protein